MNRKHEGQAAVELALILPVLLLILMGLLDLGRLFYFEEALANAAREGARYGAANPDKTIPEIQVRAKDEAATNIDPSALTVDVNCKPIASGNNRKVEVKYVFTLVTPFMQVLLQGPLGNPNGNMNLSATSSMPTSSYAVIPGCT